MSNSANGISAARGDTKAIRTQAADWILAQRLTESWSDADQAALNAWLEESLVHRLAYLRLEAAWIRTRRLAALRPRNRGGIESSAATRRPLLMKIAAASIVLAAAVVTIAYSLQPGAKTYATAIGNRATISLSDGSTIELNTDTVLHVSDGPRQRNAILEKGEAFFHIRHDSSRPFTVLAAGHRITDLGTEFTVRRDPADLTVALLEGRARFDSDGIWSKSQSAVLAPGDILKSTGASLSIARRPVAKLANELAWRHGVLVFENATLQDAARELNRYNAQRIVIADDAVGRLKFDASIRTDGIQVFTRVARQVFGLRVETRGNEVVISR